MALQTADALAKADEETAARRLKFAKALEKWASRRRVEDNRRKRRGIDDRVGRSSRRSSRSTR
jgi:hypothetical protein